MEWLENLFVNQSAIQAVVLLSLICATGLGLGKIKVGNVSLGVTFVFFMGILAGNMGLSIQHDMLISMEDFGLVLFVYALGLQVGPGFFSSLHSEGIRLNLLGVGVILIGTLLAIAFSYFTPVSLPNMMGILCGATTNTPALGAAQQTLSQLGLPGSGSALGCAVTYPLGVVGVILAMMLLRKFVVRQADLKESNSIERNHTFIAEFVINNQGIIGKSIVDIARISETQFVISRVWREGKVFIPSSEMKLLANDRILVCTTDKEVPMLEMIFGKKEDTDWNKEDIDWNAIDSQLVSQRIVVTRTSLNGKQLGSLHLRNNYGINITRISRNGIILLASPNLRLQYGDRLTVVGEEAAIKNVENVLGNTVKHLNEPNLAAIFIGLILGLAIGTIPVHLPGMSVPVSLGLAGGPIVVGILIGTFGPRFHIVTYSTRSANLMLRKLGLSLYLACLGLDAGTHFMETIVRPEGLLWVGLGFVITVVPVLIMGYLAMRIWKLNFGNTCGMLCGSMANPMALTYANDTVTGDTPAVSYATVYPISMFLRVIIVQIVLMSLL